MYTISYGSLAGTRVSSLAGGRFVLLRVISDILYLDHDVCIPTRSLTPDQSVAATGVQYWLEGVHAAIGDSSSSEFSLRTTSTSPWLRAAPVIAAMDSQVCEEELLELEVPLIESEPKLGAFSKEPCH